MLVGRFGAAFTDNRGYGAVSVGVYAFQGRLQQGAGLLAITLGGGEGRFAYGKEGLVPGEGGPVLCVLSGVQYMRGMQVYRGISLGRGLSEAGMLAVCGVQESAPFCWIQAFAWISKGAVEVGPILSLRMLTT